MCQSAKLEVTGSNSNWTNTQGLNLSNWGESAAFVKTAYGSKDFIFSDKYMIV